MIAVKFRTVSEFATTNPTELGRQLSQLEDGHEEALSKVAALAEPTPTVSGRKRATDLAKLDELTLADATSANVMVLLPTPSTKIAGKSLVVIAVSAANNVIVQPVAGLVNGAASLTIAAVGATRFYCSGEGWYA